MVGISHLIAIRQHYKEIKNITNNHFNFETSGNFDFLHFEIFINSEKELSEINKMLDVIVFYDSISEVC